MPRTDPQWDQIQKEMEALADKADSITSARMATDKKLRDLRLSKRAEALKLVAVNDPLQFKLKIDNAFSDDAKKKFLSAAEDFSRLVSNSTRPVGVSSAVVNANPLAPGETVREFYRQKNASLNLANFTSEDAVVHELGHWWEDLDRRTNLKRLLDWRNSRIQPTESRRALHDIGSVNYDPHEVGWKDEFFDVYIGKDYGNAASEVMSMGLQEMYKDPISFSLKDADMFDFVYNSARGR